MKKRRVLMATLVLLAIAAILAPVALASLRSDPRLDAGHREAVVAEAKTFFDNPFERMLQLGFAVTGEAAGEEARCPWLVEAFSLFGIPAGRVLITCDGDAQRA